MFLYLFPLTVEFTFLFPAYNLYIFSFVWCILPYVCFNIFSSVYTYSAFHTLTNSFMFMCLILCSSISNLSDYLLHLYQFFALPLFIFALSITYPCTALTFPFHFIIYTVNFCYPHNALDNS